MTTPFTENDIKRKVQISSPKEGPLSLFVLSESEYNEYLIKHRLDSMKKIESDVIVLRKLSSDLSNIVSEQSPNIKKITKETKNANESTKNAVEKIETLSDESCNCYSCNIF